MTEPKFTPGPWKLHLRFLPGREWPDLCVQYPALKEATKEDITLMNAAPDMYAELVRVNEFFRREFGYPQKRIETLLAKARGEA